MNWALLHYKLAYSKAVDVPKLQSCQTCSGCSHEKSLRLKTIAFKLFLQKPKWRHVLLLQFAIFAANTETYRVIRLSLLALGKAVSFVMKTFRDLLWAATIRIAEAQPPNQTKSRCTEISTYTYSYASISMTFSPPDHHKRLKRGYVALERA